MAVDEPDEEIMTVFSDLCEVHQKGIGTDSKFTSGRPVFWSSNIPEFCFDYIIMI